VVYGLLALLTETTPVDKGKTLPPKVVNCKNFIQSYRPNEERKTRWSLNLPNDLPREGEDSPDCNVLFFLISIALHFKLVITC